MPVDDEGFSAGEQIKAKDLEQGKDLAEKRES
jgi:hypothetical protein